MCVCVLCVRGVGADQWQNPSRVHRVSAAAALCASCRPLGALDTASATDPGISAPPPKPDGRTDVETPAQDRPNHSAPEPESGERLALWRPIRLGSLGSTRLPLARGSAPQPRLLLCEMGRTASPALQVSFPPPSRATPLSVVRRIFENASHRPRAMLRSHRPREPSSARAK